MDNKTKEKSGQEKIEVPEEEKTINYYSKLLYFDALNYARRFFSDLNFWNLDKPFNKITKFVEAAHKGGWQLEVFIDAGIQTEETLEKWKSRRATQVKKCKLDVPPGLAILYGDMFKDLNVPVYYSELDNDDTIAVYAEYEGAVVLSGDKDYYRYSKANFPIFCDYEIINDKLQLIPGQDFIHPSPRDLLDPPPMTHYYYPTIKRLKETGEFMKGCPSALTKYTGNLHELCRPLREAFYYRVGIKGTVTESFIEYHVMRKNTFWSKTYVYPDSRHLALLDDPIAAVEFFLPSLSRPEQASDLDWNNHIFGLTAIVCEYIQFVRGEPLHFAIKEVHSHLLKKGVIKDLDTEMLQKLMLESKKKRQLERAARIAQLEALGADFYYGDETEVVTRIDESKEHQEVKADEPKIEPVAVEEMKSSVSQASSAAESIEPKVEEANQMVYRPKSKPDEEVVPEKLNVEEETKSQKKDGAKKKTLKFVKKTQKRYPKNQPMVWQRKAVQSSDAVVDVSKAIVQEPTV